MPILIVTQGLVALLTAQAVDAQQAAVPAQPATTVEQIGDAIANARRNEVTQIDATPTRTVAATQLNHGPRDLAAQQLTDTRRTAAAPPALSSLRDGHTVSVLVIHGHDRCDPGPGKAPPADCAHILDQRAQEFAAPAPPDPIPEDIAIASPPSTRRSDDAESLAKGLLGLEGADGAVAAAMGGVVTQGLPSAASSTPSLSTFGAPAPSSTSSSPGGPSTTTLPGGIVVTVTPK
jgi:hypothetical protein